MKLPTTIAILVLLSACSTPPVIGTGSDPSDAAAPVPAFEYRPVMEGTVEHRPVEPRSWIEQNERVAPKPRGAQ